MATSSGVVLLCSFWCHSSIQEPFFSLMWLRCMMLRISSRTACARAPAALRAPQARRGARPPALPPGSAPAGTAGPACAWLARASAAGRTARGAGLPMQRYHGSLIERAHGAVHTCKCSLTDMSPAVHVSAMPGPLTPSRHMHATHTACDTCVGLHAMCQCRASCTGAVGPPCMRCRRNLPRHAARQRRPIRCAGRACALPPRPTVPSIARAHSCASPPVAACACTVACVHAAL